MKVQIKLAVFFLISTFSSCDLPKFNLEFEEIPNINQTIGLGTGQEVGPNFKNGFIEEAEGIYIFVGSDREGNFLATKFILEKDDKEERNFKLRIESFNSSNSNFPKSVGRAIVRNQAESDTYIVMGTTEDDFYLANMDQDLNIKGRPLFFKDLIKLKPIEKVIALDLIQDSNGGYLLTGAIKQVGRPERLMVLHLANDLTFIEENFFTLSRGITGKRIVQIDEKVVVILGFGDEQTNLGVFNLGGGFSTKLVNRSIRSQMSDMSINPSGTIGIVSWVNGNYEFATFDRNLNEITLPEIIESYNSPSQLAISFNRSNEFLIGGAGKESGTEARTIISRGTSFQNPLNNSLGSGDGNIIINETAIFLGQSLDFGLVYLGIAEVEPELYLFHFVKMDEASLTR